MTNSRVAGLLTSWSRVCELGRIAGLFAVAACHRTSPQAIDVSPTADAITVEVHTATDTLPTVARVAVQVEPDTVRHILAPGPRGTFHGALPPGATHAMLTVVMPGHWTTETRVALPPERPARFVIRPRALMARDSMPRPRVVGDFNAFDNTTAVLLRREPDGTLRADVPFTGASSRFHVYGIGGPDADAWIPVATYAPAPDSADGVRFAGVLAPVRDTLRFVVTPAMLRTPYQRPAMIETVTADSALSLVNALTLERRDATMFNLLLPELRGGTRDSTLARARDRAQSLATPGHDMRVRVAASVSIMGFWTLDAPRPVADAQALLALVPPGSAWMHDRDVVEATSRAVFFSDTSAYAGAADSARRTERRSALLRAYLLPAGRNASLPRATRAAAYRNLVFGVRGAVPQDDLDGLLDEAVAALPGDESLTSMVTSFGRGRVLRVGAQFPAFTMRALGDSTAPPITNESFRGKLTLIDFWGIWCAPCVAEMPVLHAAYAKYASRGFTILSIDTDPDVARVAAFRRDKWPMPWLHGWSGDGPFSPALKSLGVIGFPTAVLVGPDGRILAVDLGLRGTALDATLAKLLP